MIQIHGVLREALAFDADDAVRIGRGNRDDVQVNRGCNHPPVVVVGVVPGKLASSGNRVERGLAVGPVKPFKGLHCGTVAGFLRLQCGGAVDVGQALVKSAALESGLEFRGNHESVSFLA